jgi:sphingolipid delta-4 desaturase
MGAGGESGSQRRTDFVYRDQAEPHASRKTEILKKYPEIKQLMGHEPLTKYIVAATVALQVGMAALTLSWSWPAYLAAIYIVGATANHSLFLAIHELSHNLGFKSQVMNKLCGMIANMPIGIPYSITFKPYHMEHHRYQGDDGVDTDIPTQLEGYFITKASSSKLDHTIRKFIFMFCQIFAYAFRPMLVKPSLVPKDGWIALNWIVVVNCIFAGFRILHVAFLRTLAFEHARVACPS